MTFINRPDDIKLIRDLILIFPVTAILGARQVGKTTLARMVAKESTVPVTQFDLEFD